MELFKKQEISEIGALLISLFVCIVSLSCKCLWILTGVTFCLTHFLQSALALFETRSPFRCWVDLLNKMEKSASFPCQNCYCYVSTEGNAFSCFMPV